MIITLSCWKHFCIFALFLFFWCSYSYVIAFIRKAKTIIIHWFSSFLIMSLCLKVSDYAFHSCFSLILKAFISFKTSFISSLNIHWLYFTEYSFHCILQYKILFSFHFCKIFSIFYSYSSSISLKVRYLSIKSSFNLWLYNFKRNTWRTE